MELTPDMLGKVHYFEYRVDGTGEVVRVTDKLVGYFVDMIGTILIFENTVPRETQGKAAEIFGGFIASEQSTLSEVEEGA